jgi:hypothetical protein
VRLLEKCLIRLYFRLTVAVVLALAGGISISRPILTTRFPASESTLMLNFVSEVVNVLSFLLLTVLIDCADMATDLS